MKKTVNINLSHKVFHIDEDAYERLVEYLDKLRAHFAKEEGCAEILDDIENRIAELFSEHLRFGMEVISLPEVTEVINILGSPEDIVSPLDDEQVNADATAEETQSEEPAKEKVQAPRRLFRDPDNQILGGVASGLGWYLGIDATFIRLFLVLLTPLWFTSVWIYLLLWICIPAARTTSQKLQMKRQPVDISSIVDEVSKETESIRKNGFWDGVGNVFRALFKFIFACIGLIIGGILLVIILGFIGGILGIIFLETGLISGLPFWHTYTSQYSALMGVSALLTFGIPLYAVLRSILSHSLNWKPQNKAVTIILCILWAIGAVGLIYIGFFQIPSTLVSVGCTI